MTSNNKTSSGTLHKRLSRVVAILVAMSLLMGSFALAFDGAQTDGVSGAGYSAESCNEAFAPDAPVQEGGGNAAAGAGEGDLVSPEEVPGAASAAAVQILNAAPTALHFPVVVTQSWENRRASTTGDFPDDPSTYRVQFRENGHVALTLYARPGYSLSPVATAIHGFLNSRPVTRQPNPEISTWDRYDRYSQHQNYLGENFYQTVLTPWLHSAILRIPMEIDVHFDRIWVNLRDINFGTHAPGYISANVANTADLRNLRNLTAIDDGSRRGAISSLNLTLVEGCGAANCQRNCGFPYNGTSFFHFPNGAGTYQTPAIPGGPHSTWHEIANIAPNQWLSAGVYRQRVAVDHMGEPLGHFNLEFRVARPAVTVDIQNPRPWAWTLDPAQRSAEIGFGNAFLNGSNFYRTDTFAHPVAFANTIELPHNGPRREGDIRAIFDLTCPYSFFCQINPPHVGNAGLGYRALPETREVNSHPGGSLFAVTLRPTPVPRVDITSFNQHINVDVPNNYPGFNSATHVTVSAVQNGRINIVINNPPGGYHFPEDTNRIHITFPPGFLVVERRVEANGNLRIGLMPQRNVTFELNGGSYAPRPGDSVISRDVQQGTRIGLNNVPAVARPHFTFLGWQELVNHNLIGNPMSPEAVANWTVGGADLRFRAIWRLPLIEVDIHHPSQGPVHLRGQDGSWFNNVQNSPAPGNNNDRLVTIPPPPDTYFPRVPNVIRPPAGYYVVDGMETRVNPDGSLIVTLRPLRVIFELNGGRVGELTREVVRSVPERGSRVADAGDVPAPEKEDAELLGWKERTNGSVGGAMMSPEQVAAMVVHHSRIFVAQWADNGNGDDDDNGDDNDNGDDGGPQRVPEVEIEKDDNGDTNVNAPGFEDPDSDSSTDDDGNTTVVITPPENGYFDEDTIITPPPGYEVVDREIDDEGNLIVVIRPRPPATAHHAYLIGFEDGTIRPNAPLTRAQVATIFFRLMPHSDRAHYWTQQNPFPDVALQSWFNNAISTTANADVFHGVDDGTFQSNRAITRAEFTAALVRFMEVPLVQSGTNRFTDVAADHWARAYIQTAAQNGWLTIFGTGSFLPDQPISRAQAAAMINYALERLPETPDDLLGGMRVWPDNTNRYSWYYLHIQEATNSHYYERRGSGPFESWTRLTDELPWYRLELPTSRPLHLFQ